MSELPVCSAGDGAIRAPLSNAGCQPPTKKGCISGCVVVSVGGVLTASTTTTGRNKMSVLTQCDGLVLFGTSDQLTESGVEVPTGDWTRQWLFHPNSILAPPTPLCRTVCSLVNGRCGVCYETRCGTPIHRGLWITSPREPLPLGRPGPCTSSPGRPLTHPVCAWWPWRDGGGDFSPAKQRVVIDVAETSVLIFCSPAAFQ